MPIVPQGRQISSTSSSTSHYTADGYDAMQYTDRDGNTDQIVLYGHRIVRGSDGMVMGHGDETAARKMIERGDLSRQVT